MLVPISAREVISAFSDPEAEETDDASDEEPLDSGESQFEPEMEPAVVAVAAGGQAGMYAAARPGFEEESGENLDIPAFLRKGNL
jgi:hypothetical protein